MSNTTDSSQGEFLRFPTGAISKGAWCSSCKKYNARQAACDVIIEREDGRILLSKRAREPEKGKWEIPGGYLDWNETAEECAKREVKEEVGLEVANLRFFKAYSSPHRDPDDRQVIAFCFIGSVAGEISLDSTEVIDAQWFSLENVPEEMAFDHKEMIQDYRKDKDKNTKAVTNNSKPYTEQRPWGKFEQFTHNQTSTVKIITVNPGSRLSLQSHTSRDEMWVALDNGVVAEINGEERILQQGERVFIKRGAKHRLAAKESTVRVLEVAFGTFDENDITRYEDDFGRAPNTN